MTKYGLLPDGEGWFVVNARDIRWRDTGPLGVYCSFEADAALKHGAGVERETTDPSEAYAGVPRLRCAYRVGLLPVR